MCYKVSCIFLIPHCLLGSKHLYPIVLSVSVLLIQQSLPANIITFYFANPRDMPTVFVIYSPPHSLYFNSPDLHCCSKCTGGFLLQYLHYGCCSIWDKVSTDQVLTEWMRIWHLWHRYVNE